MNTRLAFFQFLAFFLIFNGNIIFGQQVKVYKEVLPNGLTVLLNEDPQLPICTGAVGVKAGAKYDPADATGMGHYLEHMLFKGTQNMGTVNFEQEKPFLDSVLTYYDKLGQTTDEKLRTEIQQKINDFSQKAGEFAVPNEMDRMLGSIGSTGVNAFTSWEEIVYHNSFPPHEMEKWLDLYAERFQKPVFRLFQSELETVYEEKNRGSDNFATRLMEEFLASFFKKHPYGTQSVIGTTDHLKNPSLRKMYEYFDKYYVPGNMVLVITGAFQTEQILPMIREKFGKIPASKLPPAYPKYPEDEFKGREVVEKKLTPVKLGIIGFRTVPKGHPDEIPLMVLTQMLSNSGQTGLLDQLMLNDQLLAAQLFPINLQDHGAMACFFVPKILGQSLEQAEKLVLNQIDTLKKGLFSDELFNQVKTNMALEFQRDLESPKERVYSIIETFIYNESWEEFLKFPDQVAQVNKSDILRVAEKYLGSNYLAFFSKMGFPKKDKLAKPGFKPIIPKAGKQSPYAQKFNTLSSGNAILQPVEKGKDIQINEINGFPVYSTTNPLNDIFTLTFRFRVGQVEEPLLKYVAEYFNETATQNKETKKVKQAFYSLGCTYSFDFEDHYFEIEIEGDEKNRKAAVELLKEILESPKANPDKIKKLSQGLKTERKLLKDSPQEMIQVLKSWVLYGENSSYLKDLNQKEVSALKPELLIVTMQKLMGQTPEVHYVGKDKIENVMNEVQMLPWLYRLKTGPVMDNSMKVYNENTVFFLPDARAKQTQLMFYMTGEQVKPELLSTVAAFNAYFGGDMSSLVFQEIREFRSLAYSARCVYATPQTNKNPFYINGYIGCQGDKTAEALETMVNLLRNMPVDESRYSSIQSGLKAEVYSRRPEFRDIPETWANWQALGLDKDPAFYRYEGFKNLKFTQVTDLYERVIKNGKLVIMVIGNPKSFDAKILSKYGKLIQVKESQILKN